MFIVTFTMKTTTQILSLCIVLNLALVVIFAIQPFLYKWIITWPLFVILGHISSVLGSMLQSKTLVKIGSQACFVNVFVLLVVNSTICLFTVPKFRLFANTYLFKDNGLWYDRTITAVMVFNASAVLVVFYVFVYTTVPKDLMQDGTKMAAENISTKEKKMDVHFSDNEVLLELDDDTFTEKSSNNILLTSSSMNSKSRSSSSIPSLLVKKATRNTWV